MLSGAASPSLSRSTTHPAALTEVYLRCLQNGLRETFGLKGTLLRFSVRNSKSPYAGK